MAMLVSSGADVNRKQVSQNMVVQYPIVHAVMAGAIERVRWLLEHGADPYAKGDYGNAIEYARAMGCVEILEVIENMSNSKKHISA
jgi:ankyrin repeat protein